MCAVLSAFAEGWEGTCRRRSTRRETPRVQAAVMFLWKHWKSNFFFICFLSSVGLVLRGKYEFWGEKWHILCWFGRAYLSYSQVAGYDDCRCCKLYWDAWNTIRLYLSSDFVVVSLAVLVAILFSNISCQNRPAYFYHQVIVLWSLSTATDVWVWSLLGGSGLRKLRSVWPWPLFADCPWPDGTDISLQSTNSTLTWMVKIWYSASPGWVLIPNFSFTIVFGICWCRITSHVVKVVWYLTVSSCLSKL